MSTEHNTTDLAHSDLGLGDKTLGIYLFGVVLCIILTLIPFSAVMYHYASRGTTIAILLVSALLQFFVQVTCFLRLNMKSLQAKYNVYAFVFAVVVLVVLIGGSMWIMWHLNYNMMH